MKIYMSTEGHGSFGRGAICQGATDVAKREARRILAETETTCESSLLDHKKICNPRYCDFSDCAYLALTEALTLALDKL